MGSIRVRKETGKLFLDFHYRNKRCREQTGLDDSQTNRRKLEMALKKIEAEIMLGVFSYADSFPGSSNAIKFQKEGLEKEKIRAGIESTPLFKDFADLWYSEIKIQWRKSHCNKVAGNLNNHILPVFEDKEVGHISKADILEFRSTLAKITNRNDKSLSSSHINHIMTPLRMIMSEAANRYNFSSPYEGIKSLKVPRTDVHPFTIEDVKRIIDNVRPDFKNYYTTRFFTGMRSCEIDGLRWKNVDFERKQILVRESYVLGEFVYTKNDGSFRAIDMSQLVYGAMLEQFNITGEYDFVFCSDAFTPLRNTNVTKRVWYPILNHLNIERRTPYQTRHTAATFWLAAGESPEWIARQMGHTSTEMLFRVYSRYVPNLTRQDGSAMDRLLSQSFSEVKNNA
jgi:integrase